MIKTTESHFCGLTDAAVSESPSSLVVFSLLAMLAFHVINLACDIATMQSILCCYSFSWTRTDHCVMTVSSLFLLWVLIARQKSVLFVGAVSQMKFVHASFIAIANECFVAFDVFTLVTTSVWVFCLHHEASHFCSSMHGFPLHAHHIRWFSDCCGLGLVPAWELEKHVCQWEWSQTSSSRGKKEGVPMWAILVHLQNGNEANLSPHIEKVALQNCCERIPVAEVKNNNNCKLNPILLVTSLPLVDS